MAKKGQRDSYMQRAVDLTQGGESLMEQGVKAAKKNAAELHKILHG